jgi:hypothetical protein
MSGFKPVEGRLGLHRVLSMNVMMIHTPTNTCATSKKNYIDTRAAVFARTLALGCQAPQEMTATPGISNGPEKFRKAVSTI